MAVKIKLKRLGKVRNPQYRIVVADSRTKRGGRSIEEIGLYHPKEEPSRIEVDSERAQYWLGVGAQPTDPVLVLLKITGDWQKFKGLDGAEGTLKVAEARADKKAVFAEAVKDAQGAKEAPAAPPAPRPVADAPAAETAPAAPPGDTATAVVDAAPPVAEEPAAEAPVAEEPVADEPVADVPVADDAAKE